MIPVRTALEASRPLTGGSVQVEIRALHCMYPQHTPSLIAGARCSVVRNGK
jgi:hypothetical protein